MLSLRRILVPIDFSPRSVGAVHTAVMLARHTEASLILLHVQDWPDERLEKLSVGAALVGQLRAQHAAALQKKLESCCREEAEAFAARRVLLAGNAASEILLFARKEDVDFVVMPTHSHGFFRQGLLGAVAARVLHDLDCPAWTGAHLGETAPARILCGVKFGRQSRHVVGWATRVAAEFGASLTIAHIVTRDEDECEELQRSGWEERLVFIAKQKLADLQTALPGPAADFRIECGEPARALYALAQLTNADLLVIGRSDSPGEFGRLGTAAYSIIRQSPCAVLSV